MNKSLSLAVLCALVFPCFSLGQEYSYTHYGISEGLAGATVYCITQDKDGFIWTGTETGLSRFDGTQFKNFTTNDGLPDLEILLLFGDSKGRVWMAPLRTAVCYYYQGKIYNQQNDPLLARIHLQGIINGFAEDAAGNILLSEKGALHLVNADGSVFEYDSLDGALIENCQAVSANPAGGFLVVANGGIAEFSAKGVSHWLPGPGKYDYEHVPYIPYIAVNPSGAVWRVWEGGYQVKLFQKQDPINHVFPQKHFGLINVALFDDSLVYTNELSGSYEYNLHSGQTKHFLPGITVSRTFRDASGDLWFTTLGEGIFKLNSSEFRIISLAAAPGEKPVVTAITRFGKQLWVGTSHSSIYHYALPDLEAGAHEAVPAPLARRILFMDMAGNGLVLVGGDAGLYACENTGCQQRLLHLGVRSAMRINPRQLLIASYGGGLLLDLASLRITDTLMVERATTVFARQDTIYIGGLNGLYRWVAGGPRQFLGEKIPFLRKRIAAITQSADGILWVASTDDDGIMGYRNDRQVASITRKQGLTSNICRTLLLHGNELWVGTDKGLNRVDLSKPGYAVTQYTARDGLASDMINTVFVDSSRVYVGTPAGLCYFNENKTTVGDGCRLYLTALTNLERDRIADTGNLVIPYADKRIRFEFAGISYRSGADIRYRYRMLGIDDKWRETQDNFLEYPDLPSGNYEWQLFAVNKFGISSRVLRLPITVTTQFWKRTWFLVSAWALSFALVWVVVLLWLRRIRRRQREKDLLARRMGDLEITALKSQMNPHFIFNCLTSIQKFVLNGEIAASNKYITGLAKLIRVTLINSSRSLVTVGEEVDYLSAYLALEKMRFKDGIDFSISVDPAIDRGSVLIPPMLIQPYVENALVHGLGAKDMGLLRVSIGKAGDGLMVIIEDNGVGRQEAAARKKSIRVEGDASKGMGLTGDRIAILNKLYDGGASQEIVDLVDADGGPAGTRVVLRLPLFREPVMS